MSRIGKAPITVPSGVDVTIDGRNVTVKGPKGDARPRPSPAPSPSARTATRSLVERPDDERENRSLHGLTRTLVNNMVVGVTDGFTQGARDRRRRLPRRGAGSVDAAARPRLQPPRRGRTPPTASRSRCPAPPGSWSRASTRRRSARWPPTSARSASPSPTRARACGTPASRSSARPGRPGRSSDDQHLRVARPYVLQSYPSLISQERT